MKAIRRYAIALLAALGATAAAGATDVGNAVGQYKPVVAPVKGFDPYSFAYPLWLDNHRVLVGMRPLKPGANDDDKVSSYDKHYVVVWDTESNTISEPAMDGMPRCVNPDTQFVQIDVKKDRTGVTFRHGVWGEKLEEYKYVNHTNPAETHYINPYSCRDYIGSENKLIPNQVSNLLREDHGVLHFDIVTKTAYDGWFILRLKAPDGTENEFETTHAEYGLGPMSYSPVTNAYMFAGVLHHRGDTSREEIERHKNDREEFSLLSPVPPYAIRSLPIPTGLRSVVGPAAAGKFLYPSFLGNGDVLWHYFGTDDPSRGTYLQRGKSLLKILNEFQAVPKVSPDGCKLLYVRNSGRYMSTVHNPRESNRLEFINFCKGR